MSVALAISNHVSAVTPTDLPRAEIPGLYVHIPFCFHKCHYCDFYSITRQSDERMTRFVDLVLREADVWVRAGVQAVRPRTVFFGGGTPSLLPLEQMRRLIAGLRERFDFSLLNEWTVEVNPATASGEYLVMLRDSGVDRLSFGAQSFQFQELKTLERHHDPEDVPRSLELARSAGFSRLNLDLIYAIPGQTMESWSRSLDAAIALGTPHLSCYGLTYEPNTPMAVKRRLGLLERVVDEDLELEMLHHTRRRLAVYGFAPYEISNYATAGEECRHNLLYWTGGSYVGLGPSAASHVEGVRFKNRPHLGEWERAVEQDELPAIDVETLSPVQRVGERMFLSLRLARGVVFSDVHGQTGFDPRTLYAEVIERLSRSGLIEVSPDNATMRLTERGMDVADMVAAEFVSAHA